MGSRKLFYLTDYISKEFNFIHQKKKMASFLNAKVLCAASLLLNVNAGGIGSIGGRDQQTLTIDRTNEINMAKYGVKRNCAEECIAPTGGLNHWTPPCSRSDHECCANACPPEGTYEEGACDMRYFSATKERGWGCPQP